MNKQESINQTVELRPATIKDLDLLRGYRVSENSFVTHPINAMKKIQPEEEQYPVLILNKDKLVGFFILQTGPKLSLYTSNKNALLLTNHSIDLYYQRKGFAKRSLEMLPEYIKQHFPNITEIVLTVELDNLSAQIFYLQSGFLDSKRRIKQGNQLYFIFYTKLAE